MGFRGAANALPDIRLFLWMPPRWKDDELDRGHTIEALLTQAGRLTVRERNVLALLAAGATLEQIAEQGNVAVSTVRTQLRNGMRPACERATGHTPSPSPCATARSRCPETPGR